MKNNGHIILVYNAKQFIKITISRIYNFQTHSFLNIILFYHGLMLFYDKMYTTTNISKQMKKEKRQIVQ